jgi:hypothetical protein
MARFENKNIIICASFMIDFSDELPYNRPRLRSESPTLKLYFDLEQGII